MYDPRYLAGVVLFNRQDFFEAHEVWEALWLSADVGEDRRFVQGLIQAAVALYHWGNGNVRGARKLYGSGRTYMEAYASPHLGLDVAAFWDRMHRCLAPVLADPIPEGAALDPETLPRIDLDPLPEAWPDPEPFLDEDE